MSGPNTNFDPVQVTPLNADQVDGFVTEALAAFAAATSSAELKQARIEHTGERSPLALANREIGALPPQARKDAGKRVGQARGRVNQALKAREQEVSAAELEQRLAAETVDVSLPVELTPRGAIHPITGMMDIVSDVFLDMGWEIAEGPEAESEWLNFDALNFPPDHPARYLQDTLFLDPPQNHLVMRTHTSPVQIRALLERELPVYIACPGKVYRADEFDATHLPVFHQVEGLVVDKGISMADLKGTLDHLAKALFGPEVETRFRPHFFPFTEPSAEVDIKFNLAGAGDADGWIEWGGCGVVNPRVLIACGIDPEVYSGFAFGMGIDRAVMFRNGATDLRDMVEGDVRFSRSLIGEAR
ncbi:phenylalanyl-tRNA synthetase alpha subunit [Propionibacteriaceae bacterium ES.041]|uniref:phenylalanine--tRNA ligase subunit alpha n=1 Tax=Enemella evansiae TaxID=2016499 RepID=UPI000B9684DE|nr:phenylalanine--tRNA ligase subunit alpha [Enemella evansiae]OYO20223.1 phenylalanine--tRNA ligase subunit alpha [Enemella evansiae]PFG66830.1 phenylalanyl-tRNA synthetase alpha subunit [Propionibacteriaceae bacterium ES.041]